MRRINGVDRNHNKFSIFEYEPCRRTIWVHGLDFINLPFPYHVFIKKELQNGKLLYFGWRLNPLNENDYLKQSLLLPPMSNIMAHNDIYKYYPLAVCCYPEINSFWSSPFDSGQGWVGNHLLRYSLNGIEKWNQMSIPDLNNKLKTWPEEYKYSIDSILHQEIKINVYNRLLLEHFNGLQHA